MLMEENKRKYLEMIQNVIQRMANNSFLLKGWTVSLIVAIFALADKTMNQTYFGFTYIPIVVFWFLDAYYLQLERKYTTLFDDARQKKEVDFDLSIKAVNYKSTQKEHLRYIKCLFSTSEWLFYIPIALLLSIIFWSEITVVFNILKP